MIELQEHIFMVVAELCRQLFRKGYTSFVDSIGREQYSKGMWLTGKL